MEKCPTCTELHELAGKTPVEVRHHGGAWTVTLPQVRRANSARWSITTQVLGDALRDGKSAVKR